MRRINCNVYQPDEVEDTIYDAECNSGYERLIGFPFIEIGIDYLPTVTGFGQRHNS